jgi:hypothetical protein
MKGTLIVLLCTGLLLLTACGSIRVGAGGGYLDNVPDNMTGNRQFHLSFEHEYELHDNWSVVTGWNHLSNGAGLGIGEYPNVGLNLYSSRVVYTFNLDR